MRKKQAGHPEARGFIEAADGAEATWLTPEEKHAFEGIARWLEHSGRSPNVLGVVPPTHFPVDYGVIRGL